MALMLIPEFWIKCLLLPSKHPTRSWESKVRVCVGETTIKSENVRGIWLMKSHIGLSGCYRWMVSDYLLGQKVKLGLDCGDLRISG